MTRSPLVLLPGLNNTPAVFDDVVAALPPAITALPFDLPALASVEALADDVLARTPDRFHLCGFSFGGYVALAMVERARERIEGLALVGSLPGADSDQGRSARDRAMGETQAGRYRAMVEANNASAFHPSSLKDEAMMARRSAMIDAYGPERFIAHSRAAKARPDRSSILADFDGPLLLMAGEVDPLAPRERMTAIAGAKRVRVVDGAGHLLPMEQPAAMAAALGEWLNQSAAATS